MGTVGHYQGEAGERYYAYQQQSGNIGAKLNARKFAEHISPDATVIDFGCGGGFMLEALEAREKIGIEPAEAPRASAIARGVRVVASTSEIADGYADVVVSNHALEHTPAPFEDLRELLRILKPGGRLVLWLPLDDWRAQRRPETSDINHHLWTWTPLLLGNLLEDVGFSTETVEVVTRAWPRGWQTLARLPDWAFAPLSWAWAVAARHRQLRAVALKPR